ncbi:pyruvate:ferredoxin oxidoreductase, gamma subunit PorG [Clostridium aceticum]|uniref:Pyruvate:ferredoxin oxidoreductase, gamma subunit PorG n=1 Tax=Clostridium aceticum TaxID=84022 RepID=A0A0D8IHB2_9CLOT|nr:2-oxoacid:acceptor oxidoreductase family protein [Clostridium aceticum]AKL94060.1 pyruvate:ferredoxin oxidoreductase, gamma subunit PorG [Clostridium aceticum]KJF28571.1 pyruvate ferredoxin oxidoreductase [Clostridium aceticum]
MVEVRWHGRGGQGSFTVSRILGIAVTLYGNKYALAFPSFGPERRGAPVLAFTKIDEKKIIDRTEVKSCDYAVVLDESLVNKGILETIKPNGKVIINTSHPEKYHDWQGAQVVTIDATSLALDILGQPITNTAMLGALLGSTEIVSLDAAIKGLEAGLPAKIVDKNIALIKKAYEVVKGVSHE